MNLKVLCFLAFSVILSFFVVCILQLNNYTKEVYSLQNYETQLNQLTQENKSLEINFSRVNSLLNIGNFVQNQTFEKTGKIDYIRILDSTALAK